MVRPILNGVALGAVHWVKIHDPATVEGDCCLVQEVHVIVGHMLSNGILLIGLKPRERTQC